MSFSGLKTAVLMRVRELAVTNGVGEEVAHLCAGFQRAAIRQLTLKTMRAVEVSGCERVVLGGGVARNRALAEELRSRIGANGCIFIPSPRLATDNAAMVARAAYFRLGLGERSGMDLNPRADLPMPGIIERTT